MSAPIARPWVMIAALLAVVSLAASVWRIGASAPASAALGPAKLRSIVMTEAPAVDYDHVQPSYSATTARAAAAAVSKRVPLPGGGNLNGIQWERAEGTFTASEVEAVVEYNAFCQWLRAAGDARDRELALSVLDDVPQWPAFRERDERTTLEAVVADAHDADGPLLEHVLRGCDASHEREIAYATSLQLPPSS